MRALALGFLYGRTDLARCKIRMRQKMKIPHPHLRREILHRDQLQTGLFLLLISFGVGILVISQLRVKFSNPTHPVSYYAVLKGTLDDLIGEQAQLKAQIAETQNEINKYQLELHDANANSELSGVLKNEKLALGLAPVAGEGLVVVLADAKNASGADETNDSIVHAADLRDIINLLWSAGAEAIAVDDERIVQTSSIDCIVNTILINESKFGSPFRLSVIGNSQKLQDALADHGRLSDFYRRVEGNGIKIEITATKKVYIPAYDGSLGATYLHEGV